MADFGGKARILCVLGTRPEALKLAPVITVLRETPGLRPIVCMTGQHRELVDDILPYFGITADFDLDLMAPRQSLADLTACMLQGLDAVIARVAPRIVLVQGDTTTAMAACLAAHYCNTPVAHIEAGLRTGDLACPWPEEGHRRIIGTLAALHFAPTETARRNLLAEGVAPASIHVTGNTIVDALNAVRARLAGEPLLSSAWRLPEIIRRPNRHLLLVTSHRRESFGAGLARMCEALRRLARRPDVTILFPVHPNPHVRAVVYPRLGGCENVCLVDALDYPTFVDCMNRAAILLTDSGGVQEEAAVLGKPVLVLRRRSERIEGLRRGGALLVGTDPGQIETAVARLLDNAGARGRMSRADACYGDGRASERIAAILARTFMRAIA
ncbi:MAG: non-hydrolyzing UDP-N-acetylglucosamine 2-epimerase [Rhodothalassiaceae bacterium]